MLKICSCCSKTVNITCKNCTKDFAIVNTKYDISIISEFRKLVQFEQIKVVDIVQNYLTNGRQVL